MQRVAYELSRHLSKLTDVKLIKWGGSNKWLPFVLPYLLLKSLLILFTDNVQVIYLEDGLLTPVGLFLKIFKKPIAVTIHGKDVTYENRLYQFLLPKLINKMDRIICVSEATKHQCLKRGISYNKIAVIPNGISDEFCMSNEKQKLIRKLSCELKIDLNKKKILISVGRLVERKGIHWFVEEVMPRIIEKDNSCIYLVAGDGNFSLRIHKAIEENDLKDYVFMLGRIDDEALKVLYNSADIFLMPNVRVKADMEGFGVVTLEAASCGLPVIASNLEGIKEAIHDGENGYLVEPHDVEGFCRIIVELTASDELRSNIGIRARNFTLENYGWEKIAGLYLQSLKETVVAYQDIHIVS